MRETDDFSRLRLWNPQSYGAGLKQSALSVGAKISTKRNDPGETTAPMVPSGVAIDLATERDVGFHMRVEPVSIRAEDTG